MNTTPRDGLELVELHQELASQRAVADLLREAHRMSGEWMPMEQIQPRMLKVLMGALGADRGAMVRSFEDGVVELRLVVGMDADLLSRTPVPARMGASHRFGFRRPHGPADRYLHQVAGEPPVLWHRDPTSGVALILGGRQDDGLELVSEATEKEILQLFFAVVDEVRSRRLEVGMLRDSEERFRGFVENLPDAAFRTDIRAQVTYVNRVGRELTGLTDEELIGRPALTLLEPESRDAAVASFARILRGEDQDVELTLFNGMVVQLNQRPLRDRSGSIIGIFGTARDVTRRRQDEQFLRTLVEKSLQGMAVIQDGRMVFVNSPFAGMTGMSIAELNGLPLQVLVERIVHPEDREMVWTRFKKRVQGEQVEERYRFRVQSVKGESIEVLMHACRTVYRGRPAVQVAMIVVNGHTR